MLQEKRDKLLVEADVFNHFRGLISCNAKRLQFHRTFQIVFYYPLSSILFMELLVMFTSKCFSNCDGSIVIFDGCWLKTIFTKISSCIKFFNSKKYGAISELKCCEKKDEIS